MRNLFGQPIPPACNGVSADLDQLKSDANVDHQAIGENLENDDRVSDPRKKKFLSRLPSEGSGLLTALAASHRASPQEFCSESFNANNIFFSPALGISHLDGTTELVTIQFLTDTIRSQLGEILRARRIAEEADDDLGDSRSTPLTPGGDTFVDDWLERQAQGTAGGLG